MIDLILFWLVAYTWKIMLDLLAIVFSVLKYYVYENIFYICHQDLSPSTTTPHADLLQALLVSSWKNTFF